MRDIKWILSTLFHLYFLSTVPFNCIWLFYDNVAVIISETSPYTATKNASCICLRWQFLLQQNIIFVVVFELWSVHILIIYVVIRYSCSGFFRLTSSTVTGIDIHRKVRYLLRRDALWYLCVVHSILKISKGVLKTTIFKLVHLKKFRTLDMNKNVFKSALKCKMIFYQS